MPQFEQINTFLGQIFWFIIFFTIMYLALQFYIIPKLNNVIIKRANRVTRHLEQAAAARSESESLNQLTIEIISEAKRQAQISLNSVRQQIKENENKRISQTEESINNKMKSFDTEIQKIRKRLLLDVEKQSQIIADKIVDRVKAS